jgi:hypothetical protein
MYAQRFRNVTDHRNSRVFLPTLDPTQIAHIYTGIGGKHLLRQTLGLPQSPNIDPDNLLAAHPLIGAEVTANRLGTIVPN